ncbi:hypothetical protein R6G00_15275 [Streptomyces roseofulvus]|uniref:Leucine rich repeat variant n=2 Tax=Streptomyces TaxID=1883 RepID=A0ABU4K807_9ACTN|nr:hypothetical protein [Streptomyces roseolus]MDX2293530.1 hypothetical protein [Streptomyces roseolus]
MPAVSSLCGLAANPALSAADLDRLVALADETVADVLLGRPDLGRTRALALAHRVEGVARTLASTGRLAADDIDPAVWPDAALALLDRGEGPAAWARRFAADPDRERRERLAACPGLPSDVIETLAADPEPEVVVELAFSGDAETTARLASHPHASVRNAVAGNEATPPAVLAALLTGEGLPPVRHCRVCDQEEIPFVHGRDCARPDCVLPPGDACDGTHASTVHGIRVAALGNPATPAEAAARFAGHSDPMARWALAGRPDLPAAACAVLAGDPLPGIRADLAANPAVDATLARAMAADPAAEVRRALAHHPRLPLDVLTDLARTTRLGSALLPRVAGASPAETEALACSPDPAVRTLVARRRDLPPATRDRLADDPDAKVVAAVAPHPGLTEARLRGMIARHGAQVLAGVAANPDAPPALLEELARREPPVRKVLREVARHPSATPAALLACLADDRARRSAAGHPALPPSALAELTTHQDWRVREAAAAHPALPQAVTADLLRSGDVVSR